MLAVEKAVVKCETRTRGEVFVIGLKEHLSHYTIGDEEGMPRAHPEAHKRAMLFGKFG